MGARDYENDTFEYTLGGRDASLFDINASTGQLETSETLNYESNSSHTVTVSVSDSKDNAGSADTATDATITVTVMVEDVNEAPELEGDTAIDYEENGVDQVIEYTAKDPEGSSVMWAVSGIDANDFYFNDGKLEFNTPPDYENPTDRVGGNANGLDNIYEVVVTVSDGAQSNPVPVTVTVTDENEPFKLEGAAAFDHDENDTGSVGTFRVVDDPENGPIEWTLTGTDRSDFTIDSGVLSFAEVPDYDGPADSNGDNRYHVTVNAHDGNNDNRQSLRVTVTVIDLDEPGKVTLDGLQPQVGTRLRATLADPDRGQSGLTWDWESGPSRSGPWTAITGAGSRSYTPVDGDAGSYLRATASYADTHGTGKTERAVSANPVQAKPVVPNTPPEFPVTETGMRSVDENTAQDTNTGRLVGTAVTADDADNDQLTYSLSGSHAASFDIDPVTGQIETKTQLNYEARSTHSVTVTATDPSNASDSIEVTISVTNLEEDGAVTFSAEFPTVGRSLTATVTDPDGGVSNDSWEWYRSTSRSGPWTIIDGAESQSYTPVDADLDHHLQARVRYTDPP